MITSAKNKISKLLAVKGARQADLVNFLKKKGVPNASRQKISIYARGAHNPRASDPIRPAICEYFGMNDSEIFGKQIFD